MRRRPAAPTLPPELLKEGQARADDAVGEIALALRLADPLDADLLTRLMALEAAALRAVGGAPDLQLAALVAARAAAEMAAGSECLGIRDRVRLGDHMVARLLATFHEPAPPPLRH
ncbi:hypothetical protein [Geminicoccus roseus]|uniref:hypothetical protein n=1 Tax=Geminicoccus roseus TaxID=404900 RepID=UPI0004858D68|nr:hypothetical protein [Geminicoccus roseus]